MSSSTSSIGPLIGRPEILDHDDVVEAPAAVNQPVPRPSLYSDGRGEIHNLLINGEQPLNVLYTKQGVLRSGDVHATAQHDLVVSGKVQVWTLEADEETGHDPHTVKKVYGPSQSVTIPPYVPHVFAFLEDSVILEWWDGEFHAWLYEPYRKLVQASFSGSPIKGHLKQWVEVDGEEENFSIQQPWSVIKFVYSAKKQQQWMWTGLVLGLSVGYLLGMRRRQGK